MNKKIIIGIIAGVAVLATAIIVILKLNGSVKLDLKKADNKETTNSSVSVTSEENKSDSDKDSKSDASSADKTASSASNAIVDSKSTGKKSVQVEDAKIENGKVVVPIYVNKNDGICAARLFVKFDTSVFDYADVKPGDIFDDCQANCNNGEVVIVATTSEGLSDIKGSGIISNLVLVPKSTAKAGNYNITVDTKESEFANSDGKFVYPEIEAGKIVIK